MRIDLKDPRVNQAIKIVQKKHNVPFGPAFERIFEEQYHCTIVPDPRDWSCTTGWLYISEDKYSNWFVLQFGNGGK